MKFIVYIKEKRWELLGRLIGQILQSYSYSVEYVDSLGKQPSTLPIDQIYILTGSEYLHEFPPTYIILQTLPTSQTTLKSNLDAYWMTKPYIQSTKKALAIWELSATQNTLWTQHYQHSNVHTLPLYGTHTFYKDYIQSRISKKTTESKQLTTSEKDSHTPSSMVIWSSLTDRAEKIQSQYKDSPSIVVSSNDPTHLISTLIDSRSTLFLVQDYENTIPLLDICILARTFQIPCVVELPKTGDHVEFLREIGCEVLPLARMTRSIKPRTWRQHSYSNLPSYLKNPAWKDLIDQTCLTLPVSFASIHDMPVSTQTSKKKKKKRKTKLSLYNRNPLQSVPMDRFQDGGIRLKLQDIPDDTLPKISVCTPTGNRRWLFSLAWRNLIHSFYPDHLWEWIILDDGEESIEDIIPKDHRIHYHFIGGKGKPRLPMGEKRNRLVELTHHDYIVFMDDDDYYPPESITARIKSLLKSNPKHPVDCVGSSDYLIYDLNSRKWGQASHGKEYVSEASMAFTKKFWLERPFSMSDQASEFRNFLEYRQDRIRSIPGQFVTVSFSHGNNITGQVRSLQNVKEDLDPSVRESLDAIFDEEYSWFLDQVVKTIPK